MLNNKKYLYFISLYILILTSAFVVFSCSKEDKPGPQSNKPETEKQESEKKENENKTNETEGNENKDAALKQDFIISYSLQGKVNGEMKIIRQGNKFKQLIDSEIMGMKNKNEIYILNNVVYSLTEIGGKRFGNKTEITDYNRQKNTGETIVDFKQFQEFLSKKKIVGSENILGYDCDVYDLGNNMNLSVYKKGYILKIKTSEFLAAATDLNTSPTFGATEFQVPPDVDYKNIKTPDKKQLDSLKKEFYKKVE